jgi:hypothetical protein
VQVLDVERSASRRQEAPKFFRWRVSPMVGRNGYAKEIPADAVWRLVLGVPAHRPQNLLRFKGILMSYRVKCCVEDP